VDGTIAASTTGSTVTVTKRSADTAYVVKVTARLADNTVLALADAEGLEVRTKARVTAPTGSATAADSSITLSWDATGCTKTWIYLGTSADNMKLLTSSTSNTYTVTGLEPDTTYYIQLSHAMGGKVVMSDKILTAKTAAKIHLTVNAQLSGSDLALEWEANSGSYKYWITIVRDGKTQIFSTTDTFYTVTDFDPATCTVSIRGLNSKGTYDYDPVEV
jgi:ABC-type uncharacterized transport system permease subunit